MPAPSRLSSIRGYASTGKRSPTQPLVLQPQTRTEQSGPAFGWGDVKESDADLTHQHAGGEPIGERIVVSGRVLDDNGRPVANTLVEVWQADASGHYVSDAGAACRGFGRVLTDDEGRFRFSTIKPGCVPDARGAMQAPHLAVTVFMRGSLRQVSSRLYFPDDPANADDPVLALVPASRRATLVGRPTAGDASRLAWDIHLQGEHETVFFDF